MVPSNKPSAQYDVLNKILKGPDFVIVNLESSKRVPLVYKQTVIGRNPNLMIHVNDISVSSKHAEIELTDDFKKAYLIDKGALNGCYINKK